MKSGGRIRWLRWALAAALLVWIAATTVLFIQARRSGQKGLDELQEVRKNRDFQKLIDPATGERLDRAASNFEAADRSISNPILTPVRFVPVLGRQVTSARALNRGAGRVARIASAGVSELRRAAAENPPSGQERVALLRHLASVASDAERQLAEIPVGPGQALIAPLRRGRATFVATRDDAVTGLGSARKVLDGTASLLDKQHKYLLLGANSAEMRAGSGMFLSAANLQLGGGRIELGEVRPTAQLSLPTGVAVTGDLADNWPWLPLGQDFRNLALTPRFDVSAPIAAQMWQQVPGGGQVDGVASVDVAALKSLLRVVGPVTVEGIEYKASTVEAQLLHDQYTGFSDNSERRDQLGAVATAVFKQLDAGRFPVEKLADELIAMVQGRHLMLWSSDPGQQAAWQAAGVDGGLGPSSLAVSTVTRSASKIDWFVAESVDIATKSRGGATAVTVRVTLSDHAPDGQPPYVAGPNAPGLSSGEWTGVVVVNVPSTAGSFTLTGGEYETLHGTDGPSQVIGNYVRIKRGQSAQVVASFVLPGHSDRLVLEPTGRLPEATWRFNGHQFKVEQRRTVYDAP